MKKINNKKGFTIVELVIVIAVIGVLAAILIPTFINLNNKAKVSNTTSFLKNVNTQLAMKEANHDIDDYDAKYDEKGRFASNYYAKEYAKQKLGYDFDLISPFDGNEICWDKNNKKFGLVDYSDEANPTEVYADVKVEEHDWQRLSNDPVQTKTIITNGDPLTLKDNFSKEDLTSLGEDIYDPATETLIVSGTTELGNNPNVKAVEYKNTGAAKDVIIQTNSANTALTIDAATDTVKHYGAVGSLNIIAVANMSYHEFGQVAFAEIATGRIVLESASNVEHIHLSTSEVDEVTVFNNIVIAKASDVEMPEFSRDPVEIPAEGKLVVALQDGTDTEDEKEYVWLTAVGVYEQVTLGTKDEAGTDYAIETGNEEQQQAAQQIANNISVEVDGDTYIVKAEKDNNGDWSYVLVDENKQVSEEYSVSGTPVVTVSTETVEEITTTTTNVTVNVVDGNSDAVVSTPAIENGMTNAEKEEKQTELVNEAIIPELADQYEEEATAVVYNMNTKAYYEDLYSAINEVSENTKTTLVLLKNISGTSNKNYVIPANKNIVLDLNGKALNTVAPDESTAYTIENKGILVIKDATDKAKNGSGTGKITSSAVKPDMQDVPGYASNTITNLGNLTVESGIIENRGAGYACFAIDNQTNGNLYTPVLTINGGKMIQESQYHYAVRMFCNSDTKVNKVIVNGGIISGGYGLWLQIPNSKADKAELIINGGAIQAKDGYSLFVGGSGATNDTRNYTETTIIINGGNIDSMGLSGVSDSARTLKMFEINGGNIGGLAYGANINPVIASNVVIPE